MSAEAIKAAIENAPEVTAGDVAQPETDKDAFKRLAALSPVEYDRCRKAEATKLGIGRSTLDAEIKALHPRDTLIEQISLQIIEDLQPHDEPVHGGDLVVDFVWVLDKHVALPAGAATVIALWCLGTYCMDVWRIWPKLLITSPDKRCGKTVLMEVIEGLVFRGLLTSNISPSAIFRCIEEWQPALLIDESDTFVRDNDELNGIINAGHTRRTARVIRTEKVGDTFVPKPFSTWAAQAIAGIGPQRGTLRDRSFSIEMKRKLRADKITKLPADFYERTQALRGQCLRWSIDNAQALKDCEAQAPDSQNDREQDNWSVLFRVATVAGDPWPERLKKSHTLFVENAEEVDSAGLLLLRDIQVIFKKYGPGQIASAVLVDKLIALVDRPWAEWKHGKPLTANSVSRLLGPYKIKPKKFRQDPDSTARGYDPEQFKDAFERYYSCG